MRGLVISALLTTLTYTYAFEQTISKPAARAFYNFVGPALDLLSPFEDRPRSRALTLGEVGKESGLIVEVGTGTGRNAEGILETHPASSYIGLDQSERMVSLTQKRLERFGSRAEVRLVDASAPLTDDQIPCEAARSVVCFYVLDLLSEEDAALVLGNIARLCDADSRLVCVSITQPAADSGWLPRAVMGTWQRPEQQTIDLLKKKNIGSEHTVKVGNAVIDS